MGPVKKQLFIISKIIIYIYLKAVKKVYNFVERVYNCDYKP